MHVTDKRDSKLKIGCPVAVCGCPMHGYNLYLLMLSKHDCPSCCFYFPEEMNLINCCCEGNDTLYSIILCEYIYLRRILLKNKYPNLYKFVQRKHTLWHYLTLYRLRFRRTFRTSLHWNGWPGCIRTLKKTYMHGKIIS